MKIEVAVIHRTLIHNLQILKHIGRNMKKKTYFAFQMPRQHYSEQLHAA